MVTDPPIAKKPAEFIGSTRADLRKFPVDARREIGNAILTAQYGGKHPSAKPLRGDKAFSGAGVVEIVEGHDGNTYRAVYTVKFEGVVYVLHVFQKKSKTGIKTPKTDMDLVKERLKRAADHYVANYRIKRPARA